MEKIIKYFPIAIQEKLRVCKDKNDVNEIRIRTNKNIILRKKLNLEEIINYKVKSEEMLEILEKICESSIYAYKNQIKEGFITLRGGNRVGITGTAVIEDGQVINIKNISALNFRIAREIIGCSDRFLNEIIDFKNNTVFNTLIVSPPGKGKTTLLRDCIRNISNGMKGFGFTGKTCGVVDERGEIAALYKSIAGNDLGLRTDVIENISKAKGMKMLVRSMAPEVIACDEIGSKEDVEAIKEMLQSGVKGIFTMHGRNYNDLKNNSNVYELIKTNQIEKIIYL